MFWVAYGLLVIVALLLIVQNAWVTRVQYTQYGPIKYLVYDPKLSAALAFLVFPAFGVLLHKFKSSYGVAYALVEIGVGLVAGVLVLVTLKFDEVFHWVSLFAAGYIVVRGLENFDKALIKVTAPGSA